MKKKKIIIIVIIIIFILMLIPFPIHLKDGGSVEYKALLYKYTKIHRLSEKSPSGYEDGWDLEILGIHVAGTIDKVDSVEHIISIRSNDKIIDANTGGFCYKEGVCIDKIDFQDFYYDMIPTYYDNKLYIDNLMGTIKSIELFDYRLREFKNISISYTDEYIVTPNVSGTYIFVINAIYQGKDIHYYFMATIDKTNGDEINLDFKLKEGSLTNTSLTMILTNNSGKDLEYGNPYSIEKYENGYWRTLMPINDIAYTLPVYGLKKNDSIELDINWEYGYGKLQGKYRIVKDFGYRENDHVISFIKYLEFDIN